MLLWRDLSARPSHQLAAEQAPLNSGARAGGRRLSTPRRSCDSHTVCAGKSSGRPDETIRP